jgi:hypothetical protein
VRERVLEWWAGVEAARTQEAVEALGDAFRTVGFWNEVKTHRAGCSALEQVLPRLRRRELGLEEGMIELAREFGGDPERLTRWKQLDERLKAVVAWAPQLESARDYLCAAVPTGQDWLEAERARMLDALEKPTSFLDPAERVDFDRSYARFKENYTDYYYSMHEDALNLLGQPASDARLNSTALRNLELLSRLDHTDKSHLNRVRIIGAWMKNNQCWLPVRQILEQQPRCHCNFNPAASTLADSAAGLNALIAEGLEYFRSLLRRYNRMIIHELAAMRVGDHHSKQIAALLSRGPMIPLEPETVDILNQMIRNHPSAFLAESRQRRSAGRSRAAVTP